MHKLWRGRPALASALPLVEEAEAEADAEAEFSLANASAAASAAPGGGVGSGGMTGDAGDPPRQVGRAGCTAHARRANARMQLTQLTLAHDAGAREDGSERARGAAKGAVSQLPAGGGCGRGWRGH